jgi:integrase
MSAFKEPNGTWRVLYRYTDYTGVRKQTSKRGFLTKREAVAWEREQILRTENSLDMTFAKFVEIYTKDMGTRLRRNTWQTKEHIINTKVLPFFGNRRMDEICAKDVIAWQNEMMNHHDKKGKPFSATYLKTLHNQVSAIFNHAVRFYDLKNNPAAKAGSVGKKEAKEMLFWTKDEYLKFADAMMDKPISYYAFEVLYWCGLRLGELLALTPADFDFNKNTVTVSKSYQRISGEDVVTEPKTQKSNRVVKMPDFLAEEIKEYIGSLYKCEQEDRIFPISKSYLHHEMDRGSKEAGVKRIRVHDLRHSHVSHLIELGFSAVAIADRVGHESIDITYRYAHLFPSRQVEIADKLNFEKEGF